MNSISTPTSGGVPEPNRDGLVALVGQAHAQMLRLCGVLEDIADSLPANADRTKCMLIASELEPMVRGIHRLEEEALFPAYAAALQKRGRDLTSVERLMSEHVEDECFAAELTEALLDLARGAVPLNPEALGFMLRGFFEAKRRHIAFEREHVLPMVRFMPD